MGPNTTLIVVVHDQLPVSFILDPGALLDLQGDSKLNTVPSDNLKTLYSLIFGHLERSFDFVFLVILKLYKCKIISGARHDADRSGA